jgi:hypothetical protein
MVAERYRENPEEVVRFALENLGRWQRSGVRCDDFKIWEELLLHRSHLLPEVLCDSGEEATRLRQSSPFAGLLPESVRRDILASAS